MYMQFIDDDLGVTLFACSTLKGDGKHNVGAAAALGKRAGEGAMGAGIRQAVVDRGGFKYHGRVKAMVEGAKAAGILFETKEEK
jgi:large subunit ribosomal protein L18